MRRFWTLTTASMSILLALPTAAQVRVPGPSYRAAPRANYAAPIPAPQGFAAAPAPRQVAAPPYNAMPNRGGQVWQNGHWAGAPGYRGPVGPRDTNRWGGRVNGHWYAGMQAPGGWNAYRPLHRGGRLPRYWMSPSFMIGDYLTWGLAAPPYGYHWVRYYDDAVLVDDNGGVWDSMGGVGWDGDAVATSSSESYSWSSNAGADYPPPAGYAWGGSAPPAVVYAPPAAQVQPLPGDYDEGYVDSGYAARSYGYNSGGASVTVINIPAQPVVTTTTTTTTIIDQPVTTYRSVRRVYRPPVRRRVARPCCPCGCR